MGVDWGGGVRVDKVVKYGDRWSKGTDGPAPCLLTKNERTNWNGNLKMNQEGKGYGERRWYGSSAILGTAEGGQEICPACPYDNYRYITMRVRASSVDRRWMNVLS